MITTAKQIEVEKVETTDEELPEGWAVAPLLEICQLIRGVSYAKGEALTFPGAGLIPLLRANNIKGRLIFEDVQYVPSRRVSAEQMLRVGDVVVAMSSGSKAVVGKAASLETDWAGTFGAFCGVIRPSEHIDHRYFGWFFQDRRYRDTISELAAGVNINNLKREYFEGLQFPLPPHSEQLRLADKLEMVSDKISRAKNRLTKVSTLIGRFRQAVLAAACSGKLTEDWREQNLTKGMVFATDLPHGRDRILAQHPG